MGAPVTLRNAQDSYVNSNKPTKNYNRAAKMFLQNGAFGFLFWAQPFPLGATILSAKLRVWNGDAWAGDVTLKSALVAEKWSVNKVRWNHMPGVTGANVSTTKTGAAAGTMWELDVKPQLQLVADGQAWYGFRIDITGGTRHWIHSTQSPKSGKRPQLIIQWAELPDTPSDLSPDGGLVVSTNKPVFRFDFTDVFGDTNMGGYQVQVSSDPTFVAVNFDSGIQPSELPQCDLTDPDVNPGGYSVPAGTTMYWHVRVKDETNVWSLWSDGAEFSYVAPGVLTLNAPSTANPFVEESTPPFLWAFSLTQEAYRFMLTDTDTMDIVFDTGKVTSDDNSFTPPSGILTDFDKTYRWTLQVWDDLDRSAHPEPFVMKELDFTMHRVVGVTPVTTLTVANNPSQPAADLTFTRDTPPDSFTVVRDGKILMDNIDPADVLEAGTTYVITDYKVKSRHDHTWEVVAVVNHQMSNGNPTVTKRFSIVGPWLSETDGSNAIMLLEATVDPGMGDASQVVYPQSGKPFVVIQSQWDGVGQATGLLTDENLDGLTAQDLRDRFLAMRSKRGTPLAFRWADRAEEITMFNVQVVERTVPNGGVDYQLSFGFVVN